MNLFLYTLNNTIENVMFFIGVLEKDSKLKLLEEIEIFGKNEGNPSAKNIKI